MTQKETASHRETPAAWLAAAAGVAAAAVTLGVAQVVASLSRSMAGPFFVVKGLVNLRG